MTTNELAQVVGLVAGILLVCAVANWLADR